MSPEDQLFLGVALHPDSIRIVESDGNFITNVAEKELIHTFGVELFRADTDEFNSVEDALVSLIQAGQIRSKKAGIVIDSSLVHIKKVPAPLGLDQDMTREHLLWEAEQFLISSINEYIVDFEKLPFQTKEGNPLFLLICIRNQIVSNINRMVRNAGLKLLNIDVDLFSTIRVLTRSNELREDVPYLLLELSNNSLNIIVLKKREFFLKQTLEYSDHENTDIDISIIYNHIEKELKKLLFGHDLGEGIDDFGEIFCLGGKVAENLTDHIRSVSKTPVTIFNPFKKLRLNAALRGSETIAENPDRFTSAIGAVVKQSPALVENAS